MLGVRQQSVMVGPMFCYGGGIGRMLCGTLHIAECTQYFFRKFFAIKHVVLVCAFPFQQSIRAHQDDSEGKREGEY